jgi:hypothetical protein
MVDDSAMVMVVKTYCLFGVGIWHWRRQSCVCVTSLLSIDRVDRAAQIQNDYVTVKKRQPSIWPASLDPILEVGFRRRTKIAPATLFGVLKSFINST